MTTELAVIRGLLDRGDYDAAREQAERGIYRSPERRSEFRLLQAEADFYLFLDNEALCLAATEIATPTCCHALREQWHGLLRVWEERLLTDGDWSRAERWVLRYGIDNHPQPWSERERLGPLLASAVRLRRGWLADEWLACEPEVSPWQTWLEALRAVYFVPFRYAEAVMRLLTAIEQGLPAALATRTLPRWTLCAVAQGDGESLPLDAVCAHVGDRPFWRSAISLVCALQEGAPKAAEEAARALANCEFPSCADPDMWPWVVWACRLTGLAALEAGQPDTGSGTEPFTRLLTMVQGISQGQAIATDVTNQTHWLDGPLSTALSRLVLAIQGETQVLRWQAERLGPQGERLSQFAALVEALHADPPEPLALAQAIGPLRGSPDAAEAFALGAATVVRAERDGAAANSAQALRWLDTAVHAFPLQAEVYEWRARIRAVTGDLAAALRDYRLCAVLRPQFPPYREMADLAIQVRDWALLQQIPSEAWQEDTGLMRKAGLAIVNDMESPGSLAAQALTWLHPHADAGDQESQWATARLAWRLSKSAEAARWLRVLATADPPEVQAWAAWSAVLEHLGRPNQRLAAKQRRELVTHLSGKPADAEAVARGLLEFGSGPEAAELWRAVWCANSGKLATNAVQAAVTACCSAGRLDTVEWTILVALAERDPAGALILAEPLATVELATEPDTQRTRWRLWRVLTEALSDHAEVAAQEETERHGLRTLAQAEGREDLLKELADAGDTAARQELERRKQEREAQHSLEKAREAIRGGQWETVRARTLKAQAQGAPVAEVAPLLAEAYYRLEKPEELLSRCPHVVDVLPEDDFFGGFYRALREKGSDVAVWEALIREHPDKPLLAFFAAQAASDPKQRVKHLRHYLEREDTARREEAQVLLLLARLEAGQVESALRELKDLPPERKSRVQQALEAHCGTLEPVLASLEVSAARRLAREQLEWFPAACRELVLRRAAQKQGTGKCRASSWSGSWVT